MGRVRTVIFWGHLLVGCLAGVVILVMSLTGTLLAFQPQILEWLERDQRRVHVPVAGARREGPEALLRSAAAARAHHAPASITMAGDPAVAATVSFGPAGVLYVDPYSARVVGEGAPRARAAFRTLTDWHRWMGAAGDARPVGKAVTGASNLALLTLAVSGLYLWWPRRWTRQAWKTATVPDLRARGRARDYNWHHVVGFWCAPVLIVLTLTGVVISYSWAGSLVFRLTGSNPAALASGHQADRGPVATHERPIKGSVERAKETGVTRSAGAKALVVQHQLDRHWSDAASRLPTWDTITLRLPASPGGPLAFTMTDAAHWNRFARSQLIMDAATGAVVRWEPYSDASAGQKLRGWMRFAHTGELGGVAGQALAALGCLAGVVLVWTGMALAWRRLAAGRVRVSRAAARAA